MPVTKFLHKKLREEVESLKSEIIDIAATGDEDALTYIGRVNAGAVSFAEGLLTMSYEELIGVEEDEAMEV